MKPPAQDEAKPPRQDEAKPPKEEKQDKQVQKEQKQEEKQSRDEMKNNKENHPMAQQETHGRPAGKSAHIPDDKFHSNFGRGHKFVVQRTTISGGQSGFVYGGYSFRLRRCHGRLIGLTPTIAMSTTSTANTFCLICCTPVCALRCS